MIILIMVIIILIGIVSYIFYLKEEIKVEEDIKESIEQDPTPPVAIKDAVKSVIDNNKSKYNEYLESDHWKKRRLTALKLAEYKCQLCGKKNVLFNVHHNNYKNLWHERDSDLIVLCNECHGLYHNYKKRKLRY